MEQAGVDSEVSFFSAEKLNERIEKIIPLIPNDFDKKEVVVQALRVLQASSLPTTECAMIFKWRRAACILSQHLPDPNKNIWVMEISKVMRECPEE